MVLNCTIVGFGARAVSRKTPIYFIKLSYKVLTKLSWGPWKSIGEDVRGEESADSAKEIKPPYNTAAIVKHQTLQQSKV